MAKKILVGILMAVLFAIYIGCSGHPTQTEQNNGTYTFPLQVGNRWVYADTVFKIPYTESISPDTLTGYHIQRVIGIDTLNALGVMTMIDDSITSADDTLLHPFTRRWYKIDDNKLKEYAYLDIRSQYNSIWIYDSPIVLLDFPLEVGKSWYADETGYSYNSRTVIGMETKHFNYRAINCQVVVSQTRFIGEDFTFPPISFWYTNDGLIAEEDDWGKTYRRNENGQIIDSTHNIKRIGLLSIDIDSSTILE